MKMLTQTKNAPTTNKKFGLNPKNILDKMLPNTMLKLAANVFKMLSAYFTTTATISPPNP
jgi:hypothetical protein